MCHVLQGSCSAQLRMGFWGATPLGETGGFGGREASQREGWSGEGKVNGFLAMAPSRGMVKVGLIRPSTLMLWVLMCVFIRTSQDGSVGEKQMETVGVNIVL